MARLGAPDAEWDRYPPFTDDYPPAGDNLELDEETRALLGYRAAWDQIEIAAELGIQSIERAEYKALWYRARVGTKPDVRCIRCGKVIQRRRPGRMHHVRCRP